MVPLCRARRKRRRAARVGCVLSTTQGGRVVKIAAGLRPGFGTARGRPLYGLPFPARPRAAFSARAGGGPRAAEHAARCSAADASSGNSRAGGAVAPAPADARAPASVCPAPAWRAEAQPNGRENATGAIRFALERRRRRSIPRRTASCRDVGSKDPRMALPLLAGGSAQGDAGCWMPVPGALVAPPMTQLASPDSSHPSSRSFSLPTISRGGPSGPSSRPSSESFLPDESGRGARGAARRATTTSAARPRSRWPACTSRRRCRPA